MPGPSLALARANRGGIRFIMRFVRNPICASRPNPELDRENGVQAVGKPCTRTLIMRKTLLVAAIAALALTVGADNSYAQRGGGGGGGGGGAGGGGVCATGMGADLPWPKLNTKPRLRRMSPASDSPCGLLGQS